MGAQFSRDLRGQVTTAQVNQRPVAVCQEHRRRAGAGSVPGPGGCVTLEAVLVEVSAPISLSLEDVVAVLFDLNWPAAEMDDAMVRELVASVVVSFGCLGLDELRCQLMGQVLDAEQAGYLAFCRDRAVAVFGPGVAVSPEPVRVLQGVS